MLGHLVQDSETPLSGAMTPLMFAAAFGHPSIVRKLLGAGADTTVMNKVTAASAGGEGEGRRAAAVSKRRACVRG